jgi:hypothetical protein
MTFALIGFTTFAVFFGGAEAGAAARVGFVAFAGAAPLAVTFGFAAGFGAGFAATFFLTTFLAGFAFEAALVAFAGRFGAGFALFARAAGFVAPTFLPATDFFPCTFAIALSHG